MAIVLSRFNAVGPILSHGQFEKAYSSLSTEMNTRGFVVVADSAVADYVLYARCDFTPEAFTEIHPVIVSWRKNSQPLSSVLPPMRPTLSPAITDEISGATP